MKPNTPNIAEIIGNVRNRCQEIQPYSGHISLWDTEASALCDEVERLQNGIDAAFEQFRSHQTSRAYQTLEALRRDTK